MNSRRLRYGILGMLMGAVFLAGAMSERVYSADRAATKVKSLLKQELHNIDGKEVLVLELNVDPGAESPSHAHPGHTFGYVIEGAYEVGLDYDAPKVFKAGQVFYEPDGSVHSVGRNPSDSQAAKVVVFMLKVEGKAPTTLHKH